MKEEIELVVEHLDKDHTDFVERIGKACPFSGTSQGALHAFLEGESFIESVRMIIHAGRCNCSRAIQVGAICVTLSGVEAIPQNWIEKTHPWSELTHLLNDKLVSIE
ncbi:MAG: ADP-ribosylglycohydrolase family protein [SAR324 cluster bacterium]|nr:ADP-ribosylglycohydrolase family protein [SAR324 cluster bacterium]